MLFVYEILSDQIVSLLIHTHTHIYILVSTVHDLVMSLEYTENTFVATSYPCHFIPNPTTASDTGHEQTQSIKQNF